MTESTDIPRDASRTDPMPKKAVSGLFIAVVLLVALAVQVALYWPTTRALPFGDDWGVPLSEIFRGNETGPLSFFTETRQPDSYRPIQSLLMWLFGGVSEANRWFSIRMLHFLCSGVLLVALGLMLRSWRIGKSGVIAAMVVAALHPTLVAPVGSIDGFSSTLSCAFVWIGVWAMYVNRARPLLGIGLACVALVVGTFVKEYAFALAPMGVLTALIFYPHRWRSTILTAIALGLLTAGLLWVRQFVKPTDMDLPGSDFELNSVTDLVRNAGLVIIGGLFFGDSFGLYLDRSHFMILVSGLILVLTVLYLGGGWIRARSADLSHDNPRRMLFLVLSSAAVTFPANAVMKISEMYLCGLVVTVALMFAIAADGWGRRRDSASVASWIIVFALAITSGFAIWHKMTGMIQMGELAKVQADGLVSIVNGEPSAKRVRILYRKDQLEPKPTFSSYRLADCYLIRPTASWILFHGRDLSIDCVPPLPDERSVRATGLDDADIVLYWDVAAQRYERLK